MTAIAKTKKVEEQISPIERAKQILIGLNPNLPKEIQQAALALQKVTAVTDEIKKAELTGYIKLAKLIRSQLEALRKQETKKLDDFKAVIMQGEKDLASQLDSLIISTTKLITDYNNEVIRKQQEERAKILAQQEKDLKRKTSPKSIAAVETQTQAALQTVQAPTGIRSAWSHTITDHTLVPREYLSVDEAKIKAAIKEGVRIIPGVKIEQVASTVIR